MNFLSKLLQGISFVPALVQGIEGLFGNRSGADKKDAALSFVGAALSLTDAVTSRQTSSKCRRDAQTGTRTTRVDVVNAQTVCLKRAG